LVNTKAAMDNRRNFQFPLYYKQIKMNSNFYCSYMAMSSLTYILGFSVRFFQPVAHLIDNKAAMDN
jgi:hypothetical protein